MHTASHDAWQQAPPAHRSLWRRLLDWLSPPPPPPLPVSAPECRLWQEATDPILVPARGDAFDFQIHLSVRWTATDITRAELEEILPACLRSATARVRHLGSALGRRYPPHQVAAFEQQLRAELRRHRTLRFTVDGIAVLGTLTVRVSADDRLRQQLLPIWEQRMALECQHELDMRRAELVRERTETWTGLIEKLQDNPVAGHGAALAEAAFAEVYQQMLKERDDMTDTLAEVLQMIVKGHEKIGAYELAESFDALLRSFEHRTGLQIPPPQTAAAE